LARRAERVLTGGQGDVAAAVAVLADARLPDYDWPGVVRALLALPPEAFPARAVAKMVGAAMGEGELQWLRLWERGGEVREALMRLLGNAPEHEALLLRLEHAARDAGAVLPRDFVSEWFRWRLFEAQHLYGVTWLEEERHLRALFGAAMAGGDPHVLARLYAQVPDWATRALFLRELEAVPAPVQSALRARVRRDRERDADASARALWLESVRDPSGR
jgi:hypothetical protein